MLTRFSAKKICIAVDESENARRAVRYVSEIAGGLASFSVLLLHVLPEPEEDYFPNQAARVAWLEDKEAGTARLLDELKAILIQAGFTDNDVTIRIARKTCPSLSDCILEETAKEGHGTLVVGRKGLSYKEEFLFGSVSSKVVHHAKNCTVWVVN